YSKMIAAGVLLSVACIGMLSFWSEVRSEEDRAWVRHTYLVVERLQSVRSDFRAGVKVFAHGNEGERSMGLIAAQIGEMRQMEDQLLGRRLDAAAAST